MYQSATLCTCYNFIDTVSHFLMVQYCRKFGCLILTLYTCVSNIGKWDLWKSKFYWAFLQPMQSRIDKRNSNNVSLCNMIMLACSVELVAIKSIVDVEVCTGIDFTLSTSRSASPPHVVLEYHIWLLIWLIHSTSFFCSFVLQLLCTSFTKFFCIMPHMLKELHHWMSIIGVASKCFLSIGVFNCSKMSHWVR